MAPDIEIGLTPGQAELLGDVLGGTEDKAYHTIAVVGGVGSGKTRGFCLKALHLVQLNAPVPVVYAMPTVPMLEDVAIPEMISVLDDLGYEHGVDYIYERRRKVFTITVDDGVKGVLRFRQTSDPRAIVGGNIAAAVVDEVEDVPAESIKEIKKRLRHPKAKCRQLVLGGTPESIGGAFYREVEEPDPDTRVIRMRTRDNAFLPEGYADGLARSLDENERELYLEGKFVARRGRVYTQFRREIHLQPCTNRVRGEHVMACDFGRGCMAWIMGIVDDETVHFFAEQILEGSDTFDAARKAVKWWRAFFASEGLEYDEETAAAQVSVYCDPAGGEMMKGSASDVRILREHGFRVYHRHRHPRIKDRINAVQERLSDMRLLVDPDGAPYAAKCLEQHVYDDRGLPEKGRPREGAKAVDHGADAVGYLIEYRWPASSAAPWIEVH